VIGCGLAATCGLVNVGRERRRRLRDHVITLTGQRTPADRCLGGLEYHGGQQKSS
jgi:hypothetical protein